MRALLLSLSFSLSLLVVPALAVAEDPSGRVGRVSLIEGQLSEHAPEDADWFPATRNDPVAAGAGFWTEPGSRAELRVGPDAFRLDGGTELTVQQLDEDGTGLVLSQGTIRVTSATQRPLRVNTPRGEVEVGGRAELRVDAGTERNPTRVAVLNGEAVLRSDDGEISIRAGETALLYGNGPYRSELSRGVERTPFDAWVDARQRVLQVPPKFLSDETTGWEDLGAYGAWQDEPGYGPVWYPRDVASDWAPYRYGQWRFIAPWGWTWVDDAPWGYAPFHYGRWAFVRDRWCWVPGTYVARPVWAPALVAFINVDHGGPIGWVPLAPHEPFRPWYAASPRYVRQINVTQVTNITVIERPTIVYANAGRGAVTAVRPDVFAHGRHIGRDRETIDPSRWRSGSPNMRQASLPAPMGRPDHATRTPPAPSLPLRDERFRNDRDERFRGNGNERQRGDQGRPARDEMRPFARPNAPAAQNDAARPPMVTPGPQPQTQPPAGMRPERPRDLTRREEDMRRDEPRRGPPMPDAQRLEPSQPSAGRPALPREDAPHARPERFEGQRPRDFQRSDSPRVQPEMRREAPRPEPQPQEAPRVQPDSQTPAFAPREMRRDAPRPEAPRPEAMRPQPEFRREAARPEQRPEPRPEPRFEAPRQEAPRPQPEVRHEAPRPAQQAAPVSAPAPRPQQQPHDQRPSRAPPSTDDPAPGRRGQ
jgi:FecR protein